MNFFNESRIIEVKQGRNHEYPKSNDSASAPEFLEIAVYKVAIFGHGKVKKLWLMFFSS